MELDLYFDLDVESAFLRSSSPWIRGVSPESESMTRRARQAGKAWS